MPSVGCWPSNRVVGSLCGMWMDSLAPSIACWYGYKSILVLLEDDSDAISSRSCAQRVFVPSVGSGRVAESLVHFVACGRIR
jgi:hypothetical protein